MKKKLRIGLSFVAISLIGIELYLLDYKDLSLVNNTNHYLIILAMICSLISLIFSQRHNTKQEK
ncbi:hypothetical protein [Flavobacteriaceae bacterium 14752]|uniref:hypothetical protein n=1 Tax=Mesohalobacter salilacus TaxID=2491711 RepID=UPI000F62F7BB|nr:hypothetical protein EIG84_07350 [Flavobacteriaceae bacterium 14752]